MLPVHIFTILFLQISLNPPNGKSHTQSKRHATFFFFNPYKALIINERLPLCWVARCLLRYRLIPALGWNAKAGLIWMCKTDLTLTRSSSLSIICLSNPRASPCSFFTQNTCASSSCHAQEVAVLALAVFCCFIWNTARSASYNADPPNHSRILINCWPSNFKWNLNAWAPEQWRRGQEAEIPLLERNLQ